MRVEGNDSGRPGSIEEVHRSWLPYLLSFLLRVHLFVWFLLGAIGGYCAPYFLLSGVIGKLERVALLSGWGGMLVLLGLSWSFYREVFNKYWESEMKYRPIAIPIPPWFEFYPLMTGGIGVVRKSLGYLLATFYVAAPASLGAAVALIIFSDV